MRQFLKENDLLYLATYNELIQLRNWLANSNFAFVTQLQLAYVYLNFLLYSKEQLGKKQD